MNDFQRGFIAANKIGSDFGLNIEGESDEFWRGFSAFMHESCLLSGNPDIDSFDF